MSEQAKFFVTALAAGTFGFFVATLLGWGDEVTFAVGMLGLGIVLYIFIGRDSTPPPTRSLD